MFDHPLVSKVKCNSLIEFISLCLVSLNEHKKIERSYGPSVGSMGNLIILPLTIDRQIGAFRQVLAKKAIGV